MKKTAFLVAFLLFVSVALSAKTTTLYHTSDTHGFFFERNGQGGFAALASVLKKGPKDYLLLDSGDYSNGTVETRNSKGAKAIELMNYVGYDAATVGNHEFDFKGPAVAPLLEKAHFAVLAANFFDAASGKYPSFVQPYKIFEVDGVKVAVIGLANREPTKPSALYTFGKPLDALKKALGEVEAQNPNIVVVLVHDSLTDEKHGTQAYVGDIGRQFAGRVHVVLGGHAHNIFQNEKINGVLFAESGSNLLNTTRISVETDDKTGKVVSAKSELIPLVISQVGQDPNTLAFADTLREPGVDEVVGKAAEALPRKPTQADRQDSPLNNWIADLLKAYSGAQIAIHNNGGTREDMPQGPIAKRDLIEIHPFDNTVTLVTVSGKFLKRFVKTGFAPDSLFSFSGMTVTYRKNKKGKIKSVKLFVDGKPVKNRARYTIATNSYIAGGGSEGFLFKQIPDTDKKQVGETTIRDLMEASLRKEAAVAPATGRIIQQ